MKIGVKRFTYAVYSSGGNGAAIVYSSGEMTTDKTVHVEYAPERDDASFHADDHRIEHSNGITGASVTIELAELTPTMAEKILGWQQVGSSGSVYRETGADAPYVGCGWAVPCKINGQKKYRGVWVHKVQFGLDSDNANTKGQNVEFQTETITGAAVAVQLEAGAEDSFRDVTFNVADLATIEAWLKAQAGISG